MGRWLVFIAATSGLVGCTHASDIEIRNPMTAHALDQNKIVKPHDYIERQRGLPPGSVADEAQLITLDPQQICFAVQLHEIDPVDLNQVEVRLSAPKLEPATDAQVWPEATTSTTYNGLIPERREVGTETI